MPALKNSRHERFAQELAKGKTADAAYTEAGYKPDRKNAARLTTKDDVRHRVAEIQDRAAVRVEVTVASITERLLKIAEKGEKAKTAPMLSVARASLMDAARLNGLVIEKREHAGKNGGPIQHTLDLSGLSDEELEQLERLRSKIAGASGDPGGEGQEGGEG